MGRREFHVRSRWGDYCEETIVRPLLKLRRILEDGKEFLKVSWRSLSTIFPSSHSKTVSLLQIRNDYSSRGFTRANVHYERKKARSIWLSSFFEERIGSTLLYDPLEESHSIKMRRTHWLVSKLGRTGRRERISEAEGELKISISFLVQQNTVSLLQFEMIFQPVSLARITL